MPAAVWHTRNDSGTPFSSRGFAFGSETSSSPLRARTSHRIQRAPRLSCAREGVKSVQVSSDVARSETVPPASFRYAGSHCRFPIARRLASGVFAVTAFGT